MVFIHSFIHSLFLSFFQLIFVEYLLRAVLGTGNIPS